MREGFFEVDFTDEDTYILLRKEDIRQFKYYQYNTKDEKGVWFKDWAFMFTMADGDVWPVSRKTFLKVVVQALDMDSYHKICDRIGESYE